MYLAYYGLQREPFHTTPDPHFLFLSPSHKEALGAIIYGVEKRKGFVAVIGEVGAGKTSILRAYLERKAPEKQKTIYIFNPVLSFHGLLLAIFRSLEVAPRHDDVSEMVNQLHEILITEYQAGGTVVLAVDEAQNMPMETLENLRMLSNLETSTDKLIQIILLGQPELDTILKQPSLRQFQQRIALWATICPLTEEESRAYIEHRIERAATTGTSLLFSNNADVPLVFSKSALSLIVRHGKGIPRRLNVLCDNALITGYGRQCKPVPLSVVREVIRDFGADKAFSFSKPMKWVIGFSIVIVFIFSILFFFDSPLGKGKMEVSSMVNQAASLPSEGGATYSKRLNSIGVEEPKESQNVGSPGEKMSARNVGQDSRSHDPQLEQPKAVSDLQTSLVDAPGDSSLESLPVRLLKQGTSESEYAGARANVAQKKDVSVQLGEVKHMQPVNFKEDFSSVSILKKQEGDETRATLSREGENSTVTRAVKVGESLSQIAIEAYGSPNQEYLEWVKQNNPHIANPDIILPGQSIVLPKYRENEVPQ